MNKAFLPLSAALLMVPLVSAFAQSSSSSSRAYDTSYIGRYTDTANWDLPTKVSISVLTQAGIVQGDPTGTYRADDTLNRAEFMQIAMRLLPPPDNKSYMNCFPDVASGVWYEEPVCRAKSLGVVRGNVNTAVDPSLWKFEPNRPVQYEEAVKVLDKIYALPVVETNGNDWYVPFLNAAHERGIDLTGLVAGDKITRGEMARLTANFLAYSEGDLSLLQNAENAMSSSRSSSSRSSSSSSTSTSSSSRSSQSSSTSSRIGGTYDPLTDASVQSRIALLGQTSPALAGAKFFSNNEPMTVNSMDIRLASSPASVDALLVYDQDGYFLGTATLSGSPDVYHISLPTGALDLPYRADHSVYVRARLKPYQSGGVSGEPLQVLSITVNGTGDWSNSAYTQSSTDTYPALSISRAAITSVTNAGPANDLLTSGNDQLLATFKVNTTTTDSQAHVILQQIRMHIQATGGVTVSNVQIRQEGTDTVVPCSVSNNIITCSSIPSSFGTITDSENFRVYGDVTVPSGALNPSLTLVINEPGSPTTDGDITWSDGSSTFTWVGSSTVPVVRGTQFQ